MSCCAGAVLAAYNMRFLQFFQRQARYSPRSSRRTAKGKSARSRRRYQSRSKPTPQFTFSDLPFTGGGSFLNRAIVIARQSIIHVAEAFDVFRRDQARSIAAGVRSILPFRGQIFPERLADYLQLNRFDELTVRFPELVAFCDANLRKLLHQFVGRGPVERKASVLKRFYHRRTGSVAAQSLHVHAWAQFFRQQFTKWLQLGDVLLTHDENHLHGWQIVQGLGKLIEKWPSFLPSIGIGRKEFFELIKDDDQRWRVFLAGFRRNNKRFEKLRQRGLRMIFD